MFMPLTGVSVDPPSVMFAGNGWNIGTETSPYVTGSFSGTGTSTFLMTITYTAGPSTVTQTVPAFVQNITSNPNWSVPASAAAQAFLNGLPAARPSASPSR
ncbi:MAG: hypothetical protein NZM27_08625 [Acetobacteraceae bacterium]|nr:hypothetical protein [Acetobacteraceae bacterium]MDW8398228.1 hypothetical protein [Acetobacteraceae bacterium]